MNTFTGSLLIASAPTEILIGLGVFFCIAGVVLFALSVEAGSYPQVLRWNKRVVMNETWTRRGRWLFVSAGNHSVEKGHHYG